jgi:DNA-binding beta-propeller fold protein YncE
MPPLQLTNLLQTALPNLSENGRALLNALGCMNGHPPGCAELAEWLGFHDRYQFARALRREGLPPLEVVGGWARTLYWMLEAETTGMSLRELADRERTDPAVAYRLVRRITGQRWSEVRRAGLAVTVLRFRDRCATNHAALAGSRPRPLAVGERAGCVAAPPAVMRRVANRAPTRVPARLVIQGVSERISVGGGPFDVALTPSGDALVTRGHAAALSVLKLNPLRVAHTIQVAPTPTRVVTNRNGQWAYVTNQFAEAIGVVDLERRQQVGLIPVPGHPLGAAMSPNGATLYVTTNRDRLVAVSTIQRATLGSAPIPLAIQQLTVHPAGRWVYAPCWHLGAVVEVDARTLATTRRFDVGGRAQDVIVSADAQNLYVANESGWLDVIHLPSGRHTARVNFGTAALGLALSPDQAYLFVGLLDAGRVVVLERLSLTERASIATGGRPRLFAVLPEGDAVLVANEHGWVDLLR